MTRERKIGLILCAIWATLGVVAMTHDWAVWLVFLFGWAAGERWQAFWDTW